MRPGVDEKASREHLYEVARRLGVEGRSRMTKSALLEAIRKENRKQNRKQTRQARSG